MATLVAVLPEACPFTSVIFSVLICKLRLAELGGDSSNTCKVCELGPQTVQLL